VNPRRGRKGAVAVGVLTIIDEELAAMKSAVGATTRAGIYWRTPAGGLDCVVRQSPDRGNPQALSACRTLIEDWQPEVFMLVGIGGGIAGRGPFLGDVVVPNYLHYADFRKLLVGSDNARYAAYDPPTVSLREEVVEPVRHDGTWYDSLPAPPQDNGSGRQHPRVFSSGPLVAGEKIMGNPKHYEQRGSWPTTAMHSRSTWSPTA